MSYYIKYNDVSYFLDATEDIVFTANADITKHPTMDRKVRSDNYIVNTPTISYSGVITDIRTPRSLKQLSTGEYLDGLQEAFNNQASVSIKYRLDGEEEGDWFITSFSHRQDQRVGYGGTTESESIIQAYRISITLERVIYTKAIEIDFTPDPVVLNDLEKKSTSSGSTSQKEDKSSPELPASLQALRDVARQQEAGKYYQNEGNYAVLREQAEEYEAQVQ